MRMYVHSRDFSIYQEGRGWETAYEIYLIRWGGNSNGVTKCSILREANHSIRID